MNTYFYSNSTCFYSNSTIMYYSTISSNITQNPKIKVKKEIKKEEIKKEEFKAQLFDTKDLVL